MKVHYKVAATVALGYAAEAESSWRHEGLILWAERLCDGLMMKTEHEAFLTENKKDITCKRCIKKIRAKGL